MATTVNNSTLPPLPNPFTPLAFLPPILANQFQAVAYAYISALAVSNAFRNILVGLNFVKGVRMGLVNVNHGRD
jgi:hypothetical protein